MIYNLTFDDKDKDWWYDMIFCQKTRQIFDTYHPQFASWKQFHNPYPPVNKHSNGKSPSWIGNTSSNGGFSIAMLDYRRVTSSIVTVTSPLRSICSNCSRYNLEDPNLVTGSLAALFLKRDHFKSDHFIFQPSIFRWFVSFQGSHTVDGRNPANQLRLVAYPIIYLQGFRHHPRWCHQLQGFFYQQYHWVYPTGI